MTRYAILCAALLLAVPAAAQDAAQPINPSATSSAAGQEPEGGLIGSKADPQDFDLARKKVVDCEGQKFVFSWGAGAKPTKVTLCSKEDATPEELVTMLDDAATKLEGTMSIAEDRRIAIVQQIRAEIAEIKSAAAAASAPTAVAQVPANVPQAAAPIPSRTPAPAPIAVAPVLTPKPAPVGALQLPAARPRLTFECYTPGVDVGTGGPCTILRPGTRLIVTAGDAVAGGTSLRFLRRSQMRAEVALRQMRPGQSVRIMLPRELCAGLLTSEASVQVVKGGQVVDSVGPFHLRC